MVKRKGHQPRRRTNRGVSGRRAILGWTSLSSSAGANLLSAGQNDVRSAQGGSEVVPGAENTQQEGLAENAATSPAVRPTALMAAALREVEEEVGILPAYLTAVRPLCLWESCYPTTAEAWAQTEKRSHHLLVYYVARLLTSEETAPVVLQAEECDNACWVPLRDLAGPLGRSEATHVAAYPRAPGAPAGAAVPAASLAGVYPNAMGEGVARGHCFAFRVLANSHGGMGLGQPAVEF